MKNMTVVTAGIFSLLLFAAAPLQAADSDIAGMIAHANSVMLDHSASRDAHRRAMIEILDASLLILPQTESTDECRSRIEGAKAEFDEKSLFTDKGHQYLSLAYRLLTSGEKWQFPKEVQGAYQGEDIMARAKKEAQKLIDSALGELNAGHGQESVRYLLEYVLMVITPVEHG